MIPRSRWSAALARVATVVAAVGLVGVAIPLSALPAAPEYVLHEVAIERKDQRFSLLGQLECSDNELTLAGLTLTGMRLFLLQLSADGHIEFDAHDLLPKGLKGKYILADLQTIFWPIESLRAGGLDVREARSGQREVYRGSRKMITITYTDATDPWHTLIHYENHQRNFRITLTPATTE